MNNNLPKTNLDIKFTHFCQYVKGKMKFMHVKKIFNILHNA